ncbi:MAG: hypothetical protein R3266_05580, partial [Gemmatimonadota bacterium]|nr:hypothetical protein [Gemmatimonadota bacterium]
MTKPDPPAETPADPDRWMRVSELFAAALELRGRDRETFLEESCRGDEDLERELNALLAAHEAEGPLDRLPAGAWLLSGEEGSVDAEEPASGSRVGPYRLVRLLGEG